MARRIKDKKLDSRDARRKLAPRDSCYWRIIEPGMHLGYRRLKGKAGTWWVRHYVGDGYEVDRNRIGIADDNSDADGVAILDWGQAQDEARKRMVNRAHAAAGKGPFTVKAAVEQYLEWLDSNRKSAYDARRRAEAFIYPELGGIECNALTADMLRKWHVAIAKTPARLRTRPGEKQKHRAPPTDDQSKRRRQATANRTLTVLKAALNRAWREGKLPSDAEWRRVEPFENVDAARVRYLTIAEAIRLINACDPDFRNLVQAALQSGARYGELTRLTVADFNPDAGTTAVQQSKSGKARHVVLTDEGAKFFAALCAGRAGGDMLLRKADGGPWLKSHQERPMADANARAKISPAISFHILRHTWASHAVMNGVPLLVVARNLGHKDTRMVEKHYGHLAPSYIADAIRAGAPRFGIKPDSSVEPLTHR